MLQQHQQSLAAAAAAAQMAAAAAAGHTLPRGYADGTVLNLARIKGRSVLQGDECVIYRVEVTRNGMFEKYVFLPNDVIPLYGMRSWQHRDAIPQELLKMVSSDQVLCRDKDCMCACDMLYKEQYISYVNGQ
jgi:hypothetical protein